ncbi:hypothetical protein [Pelagibius sp.]|uniref:hypothetical protein n=1 Tax=Pelagibius sp. TaxID=1931238 RepID=UPI003B501655
MITSEPPQQATGPLPVATTIAEVYTALYRHAGSLLWCLSLPIALSIIFLVIVSTQIQSPSAYVLWYLFLAVPTTMLGVPWLRLLLLGPAAQPLTVFSNFGERHWTFLKFNFLISLITLPLVFLQFWLEAGSLGTAETAPEGGQPLAPFEDEESTHLLSGDLIYWAVYLPLFYIQIRLSFVLPAVAVDEHYGFAESWRHTQPLAGRLFLIAVIAVLGPWLVWFYSPSWSDSAGWQLIAFLFYHVTIFLHQAALFALLAFAFRSTTGWVPAADRNVLQRFE